MQKRLSNNGVCGAIKEIIEVIKANMDKNVKYRRELKNKFIVFIYYLKLFFTLNHII